LAVAHLRAFESKKPEQERLFFDPLAEILGTGEEFQITPEYSYFAKLIAVRTKFIDNLLEEWINSQNIRQLVVPGAGLDTRWFRLNFPSDLEVFQIDLPNLLNYKEKTIKETGIEPKCKVHSISTNLLDPKWIQNLVDLGFKKDEPSVWLLEGLVMYFDETQVQELLSRISSLAAPKSKILTLFISDFHQGQKPKWDFLVKENIEIRFKTSNPTSLLEKYNFSGVQLFGLENHCYSIVYGKQKLEEIPQLSEISNETYYFAVATKI